MPGLRASLGYDCDGDPRHGLGPQQHATVAWGVIRDGRVAAPGGGSSSHAGRSPRSPDHWLQVHRPRAAVRPPPHGIRMSTISPHVRGDRHPMTVSCMRSACAAAPRVLENRCWGGGLDDGLPGCRLRSGGRLREGECRRALACSGHCCVRGDRHPMTVSCMRSACAAAPRVLENRCWSVGAPRPAPVTATVHLALHAVSLHAPLSPHSSLWHRRTWSFLRSSCGPRGGHRKDGHPRLYPSTGTQRSRHHWDQR